MIAPNSIVGGRYRVVKSLGGGGMKLVYLAEDLRLAARRCALAEMVDSFTSPDMQSQAVSAFQREADMLAHLNNEHIPRIFDRFSEANHHYLVMEFIDGPTLDDELRKNGGKLKPERVIDVALQVLDTLDYLHNLAARSRRARTSTHWVRRCIMRCRDATRPPRRHSVFRRYGNYVPISTQRSPRSWTSRSPTTSSTGCRRRRNSSAVYSRPRTIHRASWPHRVTYRRITRARSRR